MDRPRPARRPLAQPELVLGMEGGAAARVLQDREDAVVVLDQKVAGRGAHEHLDAGSTRQPFELAGIGGVVARAADPEGEVAMHAVRAARHLVGKASSTVVSGLVLGISKTAVTPPSTAAREPVSRSSLCSSPGSRKCTWLSTTPGRMCRPGQSIVAPALRLRQVADRGDAAGADADVAQAGAVMVDHRAALEDEVVGRSHVARPCRPVRRAYVMACRFASQGRAHADRSISPTARSCP